MTKKRWNYFKIKLATLLEIYFTVLPDFINDDFGNEIVEHVEITRPSSISKTTSLSDYSGYNISCFGENNGKIDMTISGGTYPYNITSSGGNVINSSIQNLS